MQELQFLDSIQAAAQLVYGPQAETGVDRHLPHGIPWLCCPCKQFHANMWGGKLADLQPEQQQAIKQDSNDFLFTEGPAVSGPCLLPMTP